jgi:1-acyl-sn-glycerol-3-phosphate acyltransferase
MSSRYPQPIEGRQSPEKGTWDRRRGTDAPWTRSIAFYAWAMPDSLRRRPEPIYRSALILGQGLFGFWRLRRIETGLDNLPDGGGAVLAMTHFGYLEFALVEWATWRHNRRRIRFLTTKRAFAKPLVGWLLRGMKHIPVDMEAGAAAYAAAVAALKAGELVGVFPEAGVSSSFEVRDLKSGAARLAAEAGVPLIPVAVWGGQRLMTKNHPVAFRARFGVPIAFAFGSPITVSPADDPRVVTARLRSDMMRLLERLQSDYPVDGAGQWWQPRSLGGTAPTAEEAAAADIARAERRAREGQR